MKTTAIIVTAGKGKRFGSEKKNYIDLAGMPVIARTIKAFEDSWAVDSIVLVVSKGDITACKNDIVKKYGFQKINKIVEGGKERQDSVKKGFDVIDAPDDSVVLIHDGGRPLVTPELIENVIQEVIKTGAAISGVPVKDTIKEVENDVVKRTVPRETLISVQTPQGFKKEILEKSYDNAKDKNIIATDESMLVEVAGFQVTTVLGSYENLKVTTPEDLTFAESIIIKKMNPKNR